MTHMISKQSSINYNYYTFLIFIVTRNVELSTAKCDMSQELMNSTDSSNYYSGIRDQSCAKQVNNINATCKVSK